MTLELFVPYDLLLFGALVSDIHGPFYVLLY
jgi:hypothetical protein